MTTAVENPTNVATAARLLLVDDDPLITRSLSEFLRLEGYQVDTATDGSSAIAMLAANRYNLVLTDVNMPRTNGLELLRTIKNHYPDVVVLVITGYGTIENAVEAVKMGAFEYLTKPIIDDEIRVTIQKALKQQTLLSENFQLKQQLNMRYGLDNIVGHDYKMLKIFDLVEAVADSRTTVLMTGESGTGKSLIARAIHHRSPRKGKPFVEVSCGSIPETLLESELFGHVKGSFTGATYDKQGRFLAASGGTIFLDEINSASPAFQVKLLRVLQERKFEPVGSNQTISVDVRVILASNQDLAKLVEEGSFRQDLYYRVNVVNIILPTLRQKLGDIPLLAESFLKKFVTEMDKKIGGVHAGSDGHDDALHVAGQRAGVGKCDRACGGADEAAADHAGRFAAAGDRCPAEGERRGRSNAGCWLRDAGFRVDADAAQTGDRRPGESHSARGAQGQPVEPPGDGPAARHQSHDALQEDEALRPRLAGRRVGRVIPPTTSA